MRKTDLKGRYANKCISILNDMFVDLFCDFINKHFSIDITDKERDYIRHCQDMYNMRITNHYMLHNLFANQISFCTEFDYSEKTITLEIEKLRQKLNHCYITEIEIKDTYKCFNYTAYVNMRTKRIINIQFDIYADFKKFVQFAPEKDSIQLVFKDMHGNIIKMHDEVIYTQRSFGKLCFGIVKNITDYNIIVDHGNYTRCVRVDSYKNNDNICIVNNKINWAGFSI